MHISIYIYIIYIYIYTADWDSVCRTHQWLSFESWFSSTAFHCLSDDCFARQRRELWIWMHLRERQQIYSWLMTKSVWAAPPLQAGPRKLSIFQVAWIILEIVCFVQKHQLLFLHQYSFIRFLTRWTLEESFKWWQSWIPISIEVQQEPSYSGSSPCKSSPELWRYLRPQIGGRPEKQVQNEQRWLCHGTNRGKNISAAVNIMQYIYI